MTGTTQLLSSLLFPVLGGVVVGFVAGVFSTLYWMGRRREQGRIVPIYRDPVDPETGEPVHPKRIPVRSEHLSVLGWTMLVLLALSITVSAVSWWQSSRAIECRIGNVEQTSSVTRARSEAADIDRQADKIILDATQDSITAISSWFEIPKDLSPEDRQRITDENKTRFTRNRDAIAEGRQKKAQAEQIRAANPIPPAPANC